MEPVKQDTWSGAEKRKDKRVPLGVPVECRSGQEKITGRAENVSASGLLIRTDRPFSEDQEITLSFTLPTAGAPVQCRARVAHVVPDVFMGIEFVNLAPECSALIQQYIAAVPALQVKRA